jgi:hypothetical protein
MDRDAYLRDDHVRAFLAWATRFITGDRPLRQEWVSPRWGTWSCNTVLDAYHLFDWPFSVTVPGDPQPTQGRSFAENAAVLDRLSLLLRLRADQEDSDMFLAVALAVVEWGRVQRNAVRLNQLGANALPTILAAAEQLNPATADLTQLNNVSIMNSGFSKIYSLLLDGFPIYDSRVACALASLVRMYCEEHGLDSVPELLAFGIPPSRASGVRDPSLPPLIFPKLRPEQPRPYARTNTKAAWLLGALAQEPPFAGLSSDRRLLALQSAMFMLGYQVVASDASL